jgi:hypothetical protein
MNKYLILVLVLVSIYSTYAFEIKTFSIPSESLSKIKKEINSGNNYYSESLKSLKNDADKILIEEIHTVTEKKEIPPSGDKHDYMSLSTYWWPDPSKKNGLPYIRKDGETNPEIYIIKDKKYFQSMPGKVFNLALYYYYSDDEKYAEKAVSIMKAWFIDKNTMMNPNLNYAQAVKGKNDGKGGGILDGRMLVKICDSIGIIKNSKYYNEEIDKKIREWFTVYLNWLLNSKNGKDESNAKNNHGTWYDAQLSGIALFLNRTDIIDNLINNAMEKRIPHQFEIDGKQPEELQRTKALSYSTFNLSAWFWFASFTQYSNHDILEYQTKDGRSIKKALEYLIPYYSGEKEFEYKQIKEFEEDEFYPLMVKAYIKYKDKRYLELIKKTLNEDELSKLREKLLYYDFKI